MSLNRETFLAGFTNPSDRIILALDSMSPDQATDMMRRTGDFIGIAKENDGADIMGAKDSVTRLADSGFVDMLDWKLHDTPSTVKNRTRNIIGVGASLLTVHTEADLPAIIAAVEGRDQALESMNPDNLPEFLRDKTDRIGGLLGITILTSINPKTGSNGEPSRVKFLTGRELEESVLVRTELALEGGLTGVVCSAEGLKVIRSRPEFNGLLTLVPGIVLSGGVKNVGQEQIATPEMAFDLGADFVVGGSAITDSENKNGFPAEEAAEKFARAAERAF